MPRCWKVIRPAHVPDQPHPSEISGRSLAVFVYDKGGDCGGSAILWGTAHFEDGKFSMRREQEQPRVFPIPESSWHRLRQNQKRGVGKTFGHAEYYIILLAGLKPDHDDSTQWEQIDIAVPRKKAN